jgi:hypothetical protein
MMTQFSDERLDATALIPTASIAAGAYHPVETADGDIVAMPTERPPTGNGQSNPDETQANTKRHTCEQCGADFTPRRPHGRFCGSYCRRVAWMGRNPEKAAAIAESDWRRLREHIIGNGGEWVD